MGSRSTLAASVRAMILSAYESKSKNRLRSRYSSEPLGYAGLAQEELDVR